MKKYVILIVLLLSIPLIMQSTPTEVLKLRTFDALIETPLNSGNFVVLNITEDDVEREGGYPFPRDRLAEIHKSIIERGALGVGWVISFPQEDRLGGDAEFAKELITSSSVIAMFEDGKGLYPIPTGTVVKGNDIGGVLTTGIKSNIGVLASSALEGIAIAPTEVDNLVRRIPLLLRTPDGWVASFGTQVLKALTGSRSYIITTNDNGIQEIAVRGLPPVKTDSLGRKWISWVKPEETTLQEMNVQDKYVFIGVTANGVMPQIATPIGLLEPHYIQAALAESMLIQNSPYIPDYAAALELSVFAASVTLVWLLLHILGTSWGLVLAGLTMALTAYLGVYLIHQGMLIDVTWAVISQFITATVAFYLRFREQYKLRQQIKKQFEHYLDPRQVKQLQDNPELLVLGGEKRYATFLFTDVRGFTNMSETLPPEQVTYIMNKALTAQQCAVQSNGGMVDKYIGDAMMAIFNAPLDQEEHETRAVQTALDIQENMKALNLEFAKEGLPEIAIGIGIHSGDAVIGNMGSATRFDYTAIGDAVNTAARLESATKEYSVDLLIGSATAKNTNFSLKYVNEISVKGKDKGIEVYTWDLN
jgi:adenylate cyclase